MTYIGNLSAMTFFTQKRRIEYGKNYIEMTFSTENKTLLSIGTRKYELNSNFLAYHFDKNTQNLKDGDLIHSHVSSNDIIMKCTFVNFHKRLLDRCKYCIMYEPDCRSQHDDF